MSVIGDLDKMEEENDESMQNHSEQTHADNSSQSAVASDPECEPLVIGGIEVGDAYHDAYRNGNFGIKRGRIHFARAKGWSIAHFFTALVMNCLSVTCIVVMNSNHRFWVDTDTTDWFTAIVVLCAVLGLVVSSCSYYLITSLAKLRRPLFWLLFTRLLAILECIFVIIGIAVTITVAAESEARNPWRMHYAWPTDNPRDVADNYNSFFALCIFLIIFMLIDFITAGAWLFHWWKCCDCCEALKSVCIFEPGEPLADGVSDPRTGIVRECAYVCWSIYRTDWIFI